MKVKINAVFSPGNLEKERVSLKALEAINISNYAVMDHTFSESGDLSDKGRRCYRFPSKAIAKDDIVVLYTRVKPAGWVDERVENNVKIHFFFWKRAATIWNKNGGDTCTLLEVHDTHVVKVNAD